MDVIRGVIIKVILITVIWLQWLLHDYDYDNDYDNDFGYDYSNHFDS